MIDRQLLEGRTARCYCGRARPSTDPDLAFFQYRGPGCDRPICAVCRRYVESVHQAVNPATGRAGVTDHAFEPWYRDDDTYYCGCAGWD